MPTGAVPLTEAAKSGDNQIKRGVIETIIDESPMIEELNWMGFAGNALQHTAEGTLPNVQFRRVNEGYTQSYGQDNQHFWGVAILGGEVKVDNYEVNVVATREDLEAKQWAKLAKANSLRFSYEAFNGTGSAASKGFKGIKALIDEGFGQKNIQASGGGALTLAKLDESIDLMRGPSPDLAWVNKFHRRKITTLARTTHSGVSLIDIGTSTFGKKVMMYDGIPFHVLEEGMDSSGNIVDLLPFTEDPGDGGTDTSSIYFVRIGEDDVTGLLGKGGSFEVKSFGELESGPQRLGRFEWYPGIAIFNQYSIVRHYGILES